MATCTMENQNHTEENVVQQLNELFGNVLNIDIIKTVAVSCHYDVTESSNKLLEMTSFSSTNSVIQMRGKPTNSYVKRLELPLSNSLQTTDKKKSKKTLDFERTVKSIQKGYKVLVIMRGVPGCGKSYLAKRILESTVGFDNSHQLHILSSDDFFYENGVYRYDPTKVPDAHGWNHNRAFQALSRGFSPIIIDNTNTQIWEMKPYAMMATDYGYIIEILEPDTHWCSNERELSKRNTHAVPKTRIKDMLERYEKNITPQKLLSAYNLTYKLQKPPQFRLYPPLNVNNSVSVDSLCNNKLSQLSEPNASSIIKSKSVAALNAQAPEFRVESRETINLMDFNDDESASMKCLPQTKFNNNGANITSNSSILDKILMCNNDTHVNPYVLQPSHQTAAEVITIDSSDEENETNDRPKLFPDIEPAWGINENAIRSWDIVTPLKVDNDTKLTRKPVTTRKVATKDSSCNTEEEYFQLIRNNQLKSDSADYKVLETLNRDINHSTPKKSFPVLKVPMLDKSCLTEDIFEDYDNHMSQLVNLFPTVLQSHLKYWYLKCKGDLEWTIEFILENQGEVGALIEESDNDNKQTEQVSYETDSDSSGSKQKETSGVKLKKIKRSRNGSTENVDLKKAIESKIDINEEHYSKHLLKIKHFKFGSVNTDNSKSPLANNFDEPKPSSSKEMPDKVCFDDSDVVMIDSDIEFDEFDADECSDKLEQKSEEVMELNLGDHFVAQLEDKFGDANMAYPKGFQPVVQVPVALARQLYTFYIESIYQQMENQKQVLETLIKEDEEFARKLQAKEDEKLTEIKPAPNFKEIIDEQLAQNVYQREVDKWKDLNPDNLAAKLTREKLYNVFPTIDRDTLVEILYAHGNKYQDTVETLLASTGIENIGGRMDLIKEPPLKDEVIEEMKKVQQSCAPENFEEQREPTFYREEANRYLKKRAELYQKAQQYHQRGMREVAQFYSGLASQQTIYYDRANSLAATAFLDEHSKRLQDFNTIDLHFLYVKEAIPSLDVFLDRNINLLRLSTSRHSDYLQIITGRGKRSENGISKIKPAVIARLKRRNIKFVHLNPGLLKVKVTKTSLVTSDIEAS